MSATPHVDPGFLPLLALLDAAGIALQRLDVAEARAVIAQMRDSAVSPGLKNVSDSVIAAVPVRIYTPEAAAGTLVWFHGGGFVVCDLDTHDGLCRILAERAGCEIVSVDYRLAPEHPYPAGLEDAWAVARAVADGTGRLAVGGDSAGGNLAAAVARRARDEEITLRHQALLYPVTDLTASSASYEAYGEGLVVTAAEMRWFIGHYLGGADARDPWVSPLFATDLGGQAPAHVVTAGFDPLRDEGDEYAAALVAAGVTVVHDRNPTLIHGFASLRGYSPAADAAVTRVAALVKAALRG